MLLVFIVNIIGLFQWKIKKSITLTKVFQKVLDKSGCKPNKVDWGSKFCNRSIKSWLEKNDIKMYLTHNEKKSVVSERFITTLKDKICKYETSMSKNMHINKLGDVFKKYNNAYDNAIKMKPLDVKSR